jgi:hypothetical protein
VKGTTRHASGWLFFAILAVLTVCFSALPTPAQGQGTGGQGQNAVYPPSGLCCKGSPAFIDASMFATNNTDICAVLNFILSPGNGYPAAGAVIDARGLPGATGTKMKCTASPWAGITNPPPSVILLPAGTIVIPSTWILPPNTRLIGEGSNITSSGFTPGTTLQAQSGFTSGSPMISFGQSSLCTSTCAGISVENLTLDGQGQFIHGIDNAWSQESSYVDRVGLYRILGTGLS